mmetsp:Transcript_47506/g.116392  ORF Transcript_47506/g.116392 Transcript_47506/m.116392 type:complete len:88 (-) Transcript_47506:4-267(-)
MYMIVTLGVDDAKVHIEKFWITIAQRRKEAEEAKKQQAAAASMGSVLTQLKAREKMLKAAERAKARAAQQAKVMEDTAIDFSDDEGE